MSIKQGHPEKEKRKKKKKREKKKRGKGEDRFRRGKIIAEVAKKTFFILIL